VVIFAGQRLAFNWWAICATWMCISDWIRYLRPLRLSVVLKAQVLNVLVRSDGETRLFRLTFRVLEPVR
jgi:hypothetical protein